MIRNSREKNHLTTPKSRPSGPPPANILAGPAKLLITEGNNLKTLRDLRAAKAPEWIWDGFLAPGVMTLFSSPPKLGKTTFLAHLMRAMWSQGDYMGATIRPTPTLIFSEEADQLLYERSAELGYSEVWPIFWETPEPGRSWVKILTIIKDFATTWNNSLIVIDTLSRHWGIDDENDNAKVEAVLTPLINIVRVTKCAVLLIHHTRKSGGSGGVASRGGSAIVGAVDIILELGRFERGDRTNRRRLEGYSRYKGTPDSLVIQLSEEGYTVKGELDMESDDPGSGIHIVGSSNETKVRLWLRTNPGWWLASAIAAAMHMPERTVRDAIGFLLGREEIETKGSGKRGDPYLYSGTEEEPVVG